MRSRVVLLSVLAVAAVGADAGTASAQTGALLQGATTQGKPAAVQLADDGQRVASVTLGWTARCARGGRIARTTVLRPGAESAAGAFRLDRRLRLRRARGTVVDVRLDVQGLRDTRTSVVLRWSGVVSGTATVRRGGRVRDRCRLAPHTWRAMLTRAGGGTSASLAAPPPPSPAPAPVTVPVPAVPAPSAEEPVTDVAVQSWSFQMTGDPGEYVTGGKSWSHAPPDEFGVTVSPTSVRAHVDSGGSGESVWWRLNFSAPDGRRLEPGARYTDARRDAFRDGAAGISVTGTGRGCNRITGEFTVEELAYNASGAVTRLRISFVQHCEGGADAARGTLDVTGA